MIEENNLDDQAEFAAKALALKEANRTAPRHPPAGDHPDEGMLPLPREDYPTSGAFDAEGQRPVLERSRKVR